MLYGKIKEIENAGWIQDWSDGNPFNHSRLFCTPHYWRECGLNPDEAQQRYEEQLREQGERIV